MDISLLWDFFLEGQRNKIERIADTRKYFLAPHKLFSCFFWDIFYYGL